MARFTIRTEAGASDFGVELALRQDECLVGCASRSFPIRFTQRLGCHCTDGLTVKVLLLMLRDVLKAHAACWLLLVGLGDDLLEE